VSHELRTPVSVIAANSETLLDGGLDDTEMAREFVSAMHRNAGRISNLVTDLLDLARIEAGTVNLEPKTVDVHVAVNCTLQTLASVAADKGVTFSNEVPVGLEAWADSDAFEQVLLNFIENAVKYGREGGMVCIRSHRTADHVRVDVIDDGVGVAAPHRVRLFERFYRVDKGRSRSDGGTGLGLAIVKHLVNAMGGEVGMEPNFPTGSVFWLTVPAQ
jgi:two-component system phosphate regulon sensor histidine kinase PhoR